MDGLQVAVLAVVQGLTEFLPISSSAHLILVPVLTGWRDQGLAFDVAVHVGSLAAVIAYFRRDLRAMAVSWAHSLVTRRPDRHARLAWAVLLGTVPAVFCGVLFKDLIEAHSRAPLVIATTTVVFALLLWVADARATRTRSEHELGWRDVLFIGVLQALALIPGTSRSGITITAGLMLGLTREASARFSFLLAIPIVTASGARISYDLAQAPLDVDWAMLGAATLLSGVSAYLCIRFFLRWLATLGFLPFVVYRLALGAVLFAVYL